MNSQGGPRTGSCYVKWINYNNIYTKGDDANIRGNLPQELNLGYLI